MGNRPEVEVCKESPACRHIICRNAVSSEDVEGKRKPVRESQKTIESWRCCKKSESESSLVSHGKCMFTHLHDAGEQSLLGSTCGGRSERTHSGSNTARVQNLQSQLGAPYQYFHPLRFLDQQSQAAPSTLAQTSA